MRGYTSDTNVFRPLVRKAKRQDAQQERLTDTQGSFAESYHFSCYLISSLLLAEHLKDKWLPKYRGKKHLSALEKAAVLPSCERKRFSAAHPSS